MTRLPGVGSLAPWAAARKVSRCALGRVMTHGVRLTAPCDPSKSGPWAGFTDANE